MVQQIEITLKPKLRGFHLVTSEILSQLPKLPKTGIINIFTKHTSCGLTINENYAPDVRVDMETIFNRLVPENQPYYECFRFLERVPDGLFLDYEDGWRIQLRCRRGVPGWEHISVFADDVHQVIERLVMHLHIRDKHHVKTAA